MREISQNKICILGAQESGVGSALLAHKLGYDIWVSDFNEINERYKEELIQKNIAFEEHGHDSEKILTSDIIIKSPGIPDVVPIVKAARELKIPIISEIEFAYKYTSAKIVGITGSNGKTTTTSMIYSIFLNAGKKVECAGNIGTSFARKVANEKDTEIYILEISSFQLDDILEFKADVAVLLNITPDHLDRYDDSFENYISSKFRIAMNQTENDFFIYCMDDTVIESYLNKNEIRSTRLGMTIKNNPKAAAWVEDNQININLNKSEFTMNLSELGLNGTHNVYNSMASSIASKIFDIKKEVIRESLSDFKCLEHRLEHVTKVKGVDYINDSKATNVNSTWYALETVQNPIVWIVGGIDKGNDYTILQDLVKKKVKTII